MDKIVRIGLIGCGRVAENHIISVSKCENAAITAVGGGRHAALMAQRLGVPVLTPEEVCTSDLVDAVFVLTPPQYHFDYSMQAMEAGKHVMVEKPVSFVPKEPELLLEKSREKGVLCFPGHSYLYLPEMRRFMESSRDGRLGRICCMYMSEIYYMGEDLIGKYTGPETDILCHALYLTLHFVGVPIRVSAFRTQFPKDQIITGGPQVAVMLEYVSGALCQIMLSWACNDYASDPFTFKVKLIGTNGSMHFSRRDFMEMEGDAYVQGMYQETFDREVKYFVEECVLRGSKPLSDMHDAMIVTKLHNLVLESIRGNKTVEVSI